MRILTSNWQGFAGERKYHHVRSPERKHWSPVSPRGGVLWSRRRRGSDAVQREGIGGPRLSSPGRPSNLDQEHCYSADDDKTYEGVAPSGRRDGRRPDSSQPVAADGRAGGARATSRLCTLDSQIGALKPTQSGQTLATSGVQLVRADRKQPHGRI